MENIVRLFDPSLTFRRTLRPSSVLVCEIEKEKLSYVFKTSYKHHTWGVIHLRRERELLQIAQDVPGITHLVKDYPEREEYTNVLLKEYFKGESLFNLNTGIDNPTTQTKIEKTVRDLHSLGIARLDIGPQNVVLSPCKIEVRLIDIGYGKFYSRFHNYIPFSGFRRNKYRDLKKLERLFRY